MVAPQPCFSSDTKKKGYFHPLITELIKEQHVMIRHHDFKDRLMVLDTMPSFPPMVLPDTPSLSMIKSKNFLEVTQKKIDEQREKAKENK